MRGKAVSAKQSKFSALSLPRWISCFWRQARSSEGAKTAASGKIKWFDNKKGFGFIAQESGQDVFVHHSSIIGQGFKTLNEGDRVSFEVVEGKKGLKAQNVQRIQG